MNKDSNNPPAGRPRSAGESGDRPARPVFWLRLVQIAAILAGYFLVVSWVLLERAKPQAHTMFDWRWDKKVRASWNTALAVLGERFLAVVGVLSLISLIYCEMNF